METTIQNLLQQVSAINKKYEEMARISGANYNVFEILKLSTNEVRTHSAFIGELLNPKGSHGQKDKYLKLFIEELGIKNFSTENATIELEKFIGYIPEDYNKGGYIDIFIFDREKHVIAIENKIFAGDQKNQLKRYYKYCKESTKNFHLFYLTLEGNDASDFSKEGLKEEIDYYNISYKEKILSWMEKCTQSSFNLPIIRESLVQYINLIKNLTKQNMNTEMKKDIFDIVFSSNDNLNAALFFHYNSLPEEITKRIFESVKEYFDKNGLNEIEKYSTIKSLKFNYYGEYCFYLCEENWKYSIFFELDKKLGNFWVGIWAIEGKKEKFELDTNQINLILKSISPTYEPTLGANRIYIELTFWRHSSWFEVYKNAKDNILKTTVEIYKAIKENKIDMTK